MIACACHWSSEWSPCGLALDAILLVVVIVVLVAVVKTARL